MKLAGTGTFRVDAKTALAGPAELTGGVREVFAERLDITGLPDGAGGITVSTPRDAADPLWQHAQSYRLAIEPGGITIEAGSRDGLYYAAQSLAQLVASAPAVPALEIRDWPAIPTRLAMIAVDQGGFQVIDVDYWKRVIRELAAVKINAVMPYFDSGTFKFRKYPFLGLKGDDGFTVEKAKILSEYAEQHCIQMIPQQNSLGHLGGMLGHKELQHLRDGGGTINAVLPETFVLLGDLYDELVEGFPYAKYIHVGGDEFGHDFGKHPAVAARVAEVGKPTVYGEFMMKLYDMLKQRNRGMMIWWNEQGMTIEAASVLAKDIAVFDWHYGPQDDYPSLDNLLKAGFTAPWATPAVTRYYDGTNDWLSTFGNIHNFAKAGAKRNVPGMCTCTWVHGMWGGRNTFELNLYGLVYSAECAWNPTPQIEAADFGRRFAAQWWGYRAADAAALVTQGVHTPYGERKDQKFWRGNRDLETYVGSSLTALVDLGVSSGTLADDAKNLLAYCDRADAALDALRQAATRNQVTLDFFKQDVRIHRLAAERILAAAEFARWASTYKPMMPIPEKELLRAEFATVEPPPAPAKIAASAIIADGVLTTAPQESWKRDGLTFGPMPQPETGLMVEYDVRPRRMDAQFQQFASEKPSSHHFMVFIGNDRRFHVYARCASTWTEQGTIATACAPNKWYHCTALIKPDGFSFKAVDKETGKMICRSGMIPTDTLGPDAMFSLCDNYGDTIKGEPATDWDNVVVSTLAKSEEQKVTPPPGFTENLKKLIDTHLLVEETFRRSVLEAGGGSADNGNLGKGGVQFRSAQGRLDLERLIKNLDAGRLPPGFGE
ncbi:MAG: hypothetical protein A3K18_22475 [Lentisphaerae bacterium RIFOXYA12_64_32]|nr:MAG: hypothetical protein A3K18_22475 [Lentisphaerae bacterium RIFOXYA12_64_32]